MSRKLWIVAAVVAASASLLAQSRPRIDVEHYSIEAEINPAAQSLSAVAKVRFLPQEESTSSVVFELNNALNLTRVEDDKGVELPSSRSREDSSVRITFPAALTKGQAVTITFRYDGTLSGKEESPVWGIKFAAIQEDHTFLLYPSRWFPISGYTSDRYTAELKVTAPAGNKVLASGVEKTTAAGGKAVFSFSTLQPAFPGSIAVVKGEPVRGSAEGVTTSVYFRGPEQEMAGAYGEETWFRLGDREFRASLAGWPRRDLMRRRDELLYRYAGRQTAGQMKLALRSHARVRVR